MVMRIRADAIWPYPTGLPRDVAVNTFHFAAPDIPTSGTPEAIVDAISNFYDDTGDDDIKAYLHAYLDAGPLVKLYDLDNPGPPFYTEQLTLRDPSSTQGLPLEVAVCLSYGPSPSSATTAARGRGRLFIGPLNVDSVVFGANIPPQPSPGLIGAMIAGATRLASNATLGGLGVFWSLFSRADDAFYNVTQGWVDNEFDTQRRRQVDASGRTTWSV